MEWIRIDADLYHFQPVSRSFYAYYKVQDNWNEAAVSAARDNSIPNEERAIHIYAAIKSSKRTRSLGLG